jgi:hypothetical protein
VPFKACEARIKVRFVVLDDKPPVSSARNEGQSIPLGCALRAR